MYSDRLRTKSDPGIYRFWNQFTGNTYIGESVGISTRMDGHKTSIRCGTHDKAMVNADAFNYGVESFVFESIEYFDPWLDQSKAQRLSVEKEHMASLGSTYTSRPIKDPTFKAKDYPWRYFDPSNPWRRRQSPHFVKAFGFMTTAYWTRAYPRVKPGSDESVELMTKEMASYFRYIPQGTLLYEKASMYYNNVETFLETTGRKKIIYLPSYKHLTNAR